MSPAVKNSSYCSHCRGRDNCSFFSCIVFTHPSLFYCGERLSANDNIPRGYNH